MKTKSFVRPLVAAFCALALSTAVFAAEQWATASSSEGDHPAEAAIDKTKGERWCATSAEMPQWWMVDMGSPREVSGLNLEWEFDSATYQFKVESSLDKKEWKLLADKTAAPGVKNGPVEIKKGSARWLRLTITGVTRDDGAETWASLRTAHIKVMEDGKEVEWKPAT